MKLLDLKWYPYRIAFRRPFLTAHGSLSHRSGAILQIKTDTGYHGCGEIAPLPEFSGRGLDETLEALSGLVQELCGREIADILHFLDQHSQNADLPSPLICGLETALLDALGQSSGQSLAQLLADEPLMPTGQSPAVPRPAIQVNAVIGGATTESVVLSAKAAINAGYSCLKLKMTEASTSAVECVAAVRAAIGATPQLRLDANEGWSFEQAIWMLSRCAAADIQYVEQPLPGSDSAAMARLCSSSPIPLAADEALTSLAATRRVLAARAADVLILKPQLLGGLRACRQIIREAQQRQVACVITSTLESGIGVAAALHVAAASPEITLACGLATLDLLEGDLLHKRLLIEQGYLQMPPGTGLGIQVDWAALQQTGPF
jgi:o-succinylbenzoate synthase